MACRRVKVVVEGKPTYERWTLHQWLIEIKEIVEGEYDVEIDIEVRDNENILPKLVVNEREVFHGLPGEEGYLIEVLKHALEEHGYKRRIDEDH